MSVSAWRKTVIVTAASLILQFGHAEDRPLQVLVPPAPVSSTEIKKLTDFERISRCLYLYLHERFAEIPEAEAVTESWAANLLFEVQSGKRTPCGDRLLENLRAFLPIGAAISCALHSGEFTCTLHREGGPRKLSLPCRPGRPVADVIYPVARFLAKGLQLSDAAAAVLTEKRLPNTAMLEACYLSRRLNTTWIINSGEARLALLRPFMDQVGKYPYLAGTTLSAGRRMSTDKRKPKGAIRNVNALLLALPTVLGTPFEQEAFGFVRDNGYYPEKIEGELLNIVRQQAKPESERLFDDEDGGGELEGLLADTKLDATASLMAGRKTAAQQSGAIRCLGLMKSEAAFELMTGFAANDSSLLRQAAAFALGQYEKAGAGTLLAKLALDTDPLTAFVAAYWLWKRNRAPDGLLSLARTVLEQPDPPREAFEVLAERGVEEDVPRLKRFAGIADASRRVLVMRGLMRLRAVDDVVLAKWLNSASEEVVTTALANLPAEVGEPNRGRLFTLANDPHSPVAESARLAVARFRPAGRREGLRFDLRTEHLYVRKQVIDGLAASDEAWALEMLAGATRNRDPHARAHALRRLAERSADRAKEALPQLLTDPYRWVRVHAAATAAEIADPELAKEISGALESESDTVARLYLEDALAKAEGHPPPKPREPVHRFDPSRNTFGMCGIGTEAPVSPFAYYYLLNVELSEAAKQAHDNGKLLLGRSNETARNPQQVLFHPIWKDLWWMSMEKELADLNRLDGVVLGEESMYFRPWQLWAAGWRLFCREIGIPPAKIAGDREKLTENETRAYLHWEVERAIDGFNVMYDFIKLYFGKLRPGFMVGTYMPDQNGPCVADRRWKFDVAGAYYYGASNRVRYNMIRRLKTIWPGRPVTWLSMGNVYSPPGGVKYKSPIPDGPIQGRSSKAFADSVCAWLAGAESAYFLHWLFMRKDTPNGSFGKWVAIEDLYPGSPILAGGIEHCFEGIEEMYRFKSKEGEPTLALPDAGKADDDDVDKLVEGKDPEKEARERVAKEKERLRVGFHLEQKHQYDIARALHGLPRPEPRHEVLFVAPRSGIQQFEMANDYDYLMQINKVADQELDSYRLIGIASHGDSRLWDQTIGALTAWLRDHAGLLYVRGCLSPDNAFEASSPEDHDGTLQADWPWEEEVTFKANHYEIRGAAARPLGKVADAPKLVLWQKPGFKGAVLFDCLTASAPELREIVNEVVRKYGVGVALTGPVGMLTGSTKEVTGVASSYSAPETHVLDGVDLLTGEPAPVVHKHRSASVVASDYASTFVASYNGVSILCDKRIESVEPVPSGLKVKCTGLIRAASATGAVKISPGDGRKLPVLEGEEEITRWMLFEDAPGIASVQIPASENSVTFLRCSQPVVITVRPR